MARTPSTMLELGTPAPDFSLPEPASGHRVSLSDFENRPLVVVFLCNHCPFVKHIAPRLSVVAAEFQLRGIGFVGINSNDVENYPDDSPEKMVEAAGAWGFTFPYLYDETQEVAKAYRAACTPDFYLFDPDHRLIYRGQFDDARPGNELPVTGNDLIGPLNALLRGEPISEEQTPSLGCNIKWKLGNEPDYFQ